MSTLKNLAEESRLFVEEENPIEVFEKAFLSFVSVGDRTLRVSRGSFRPSPDQLTVTLINLPGGLGAEGGGAEGENNRVMVKVYRVEDEVAVERFINNLKGAPALRKKTGAPAKVARYLADFINKLVADIPPNFTHTKNYAG